MSTIDPNTLLVKMRAMAAQAQGIERSISTTSPQGNFKTLLTQAVDNVNQTQKTAGKLAQSFEQGDPKVDLADVMIALQKANVSFQAITQVRNRLVSAYQDIMNMPI